MSTLLKDQVLNALAAVRTRPLFALKLDVRPVIVVGETPTTFRRIGVIHGGRFEGERLCGAVLAGGADWQSVRPDGSTLLDVRLTLETEDGALICMTYAGVRTGSADVIARIDRGEVVDPASYYFRTHALFETASNRYAWLNGILAIGLGHRFEDGLLYNVFELL